MDIKVENIDAWDEQEEQGSEYIITETEAALEKSQPDEMPLEDEEDLSPVNENIINDEVNVPSKDDADEDEDTEVYLGVVVPPEEYTPENVEIIKRNLVSKRNVKFCSDQFEGKSVSYSIVGVDVMPDAVTSLLDGVISDNGEFNKTVHVNSINILIDIGSGTTDMASIQGFDIIPDSTRQFNIGTNDVFADIAQEVERKYNCGYIETSFISNVVRFPMGICNECGLSSATGKTCSCGGTFEMKRNRIRIGQKVFDISDIVNRVLNDKADSIASLFKRYLDTLIKVRGINKSALDTILIVGGGGELFGRLLKDKISDFVGEYAEVKKADRAVWRSLNGLGKYVQLKKSKSVKKFQRYVFVDVGNFATKAKLVDVSGKPLGKPIELITKISTPVDLGDFSLRKIHPMMDLFLDITSEDAEQAQIGDGEYFVSHLAAKGKNLKTRNALTLKTNDEMFYVMINAAIGVLLARDK